MMDLIKKSLVISSAFTVLLFLGSMGIHQGSSYLGMQAPGLAEVLASSYPLAVAGEATKVFFFGFAFILTTVSLSLVVAGRAATTRLAYRSLGFRLLWLAIPYSLLLLASLVEYPALYEAYLNPFTKRLLYRSSWYLSPPYLRWAALGGGLCLVLWQRLEARRALIAAGALTLGLAFASWTMTLIGEAHYLWQTDPAAQANSPTQAPDIVILAVDSLRYDRLLTPSVTPYLNKLRQDEPQLVSFDDHHVGIPRTFPSWIEILRGTYAARSGIRHMFPNLPARRLELPSFVTRLREAGYRTGVFSDFAGDIFPRFVSGFDEVVAPTLHLDTLIRMGVVQSFPLLFPFLLSPMGNRLFPSLLENPAYADPRALVQRAKAWMDGGGDGPRLTTVFFSTAHFPYAAPWPWYQSFTSPAYEGPYYFQKNPLLNERAAGLKAQDITHVRGLYDGALAGIDGAIAELCEWLKREGRWHNTLLVVTADHGEDLFEDGNLQGHGEHLRGDHVLHVPLLVKLPSTSPVQRRRISFTSRSIDLAPTVLALAGHRDALASDGLDLSPWLLDGELTAPQLAAYAETGIWFGRYGEGFFQKERLDYPGINELLSFNVGGSGDIVLNPQFESTIVGAKHRSLVRGPYKLVYQPTAAGPLYRLYDRHADPRNQTDLSRQAPLVLAELQRELWQLVGRLEGPSNIYDEFVVPQ